MTNNFTDSKTGLQNSSPVICCSGANTLALAWGPTIGAKAVSYQVAAPAGALCAFIGALLFGERSAPLYGGYLHDWSELKILPELTMYSMIWPPIVALIWQALALWWQVPVIYYLGHGETLNTYWWQASKDGTLLACLHANFGIISKLSAALQMQSFVLS